MYLIPTISSLLLLLLLLLLQLSFHSVAVVLTPVQKKQIKINIHKPNNTKTQYKQYKTQSIQMHNYQNTHTIVKTSTHFKILAWPNKIQQPQYKIRTEWNSHNTDKYPQYKVTPVYMVLLSPRNSPKLASLHFTSKQNHFHLPNPLQSFPLFRRNLMCDSHLLRDFDSGQGTWRGTGSFESCELQTGIPNDLRTAKTWNIRNNYILVF